MGVPPSTAAGYEQRGTHCISVQWCFHLTRSLIFERLPLILGQGVHKLTPAEPLSPRHQYPTQRIVSSKFHHDSLFLRVAASELRGFFWGLWTGPPNCVKNEIQRC